MKYNLEQLLNQINSIEDYRETMVRLAEEGASFALLDKLHYMTNEKLGVDSNFYSLNENLANDSVYCRDCGDYIYHTVIERQEWCLLIGREKYTIHFTEWVEDTPDNICAFCTE